MITTPYITLLALLPTALAVLVLAIDDPKRRRSAGQRTAPRGRSRRVLSALALTPGLVLAACGLWPALLAWLGLTLTLGWAAVQVLARRA